MKNLKHNKQIDGLIACHRNLDKEEIISVSEPKALNAGERMRVDLGEFQDGLVRTYVMFTPMQEVILTVRAEDSRVLKYRIVAGFDAVLYRYSTNPCKEWLSDEWLSDDLIGVEFVGEYVYDMPMESDAEGCA